MTMTVADLVRKAAGTIGTGDIPSQGLLAPEQSTAFLDAIYTATPFSQLHRKVRRRATSGTIAKIGIGARKLRRKTAGVDDATLVKPDFGSVAYQTVGARLDSEIEEEVFRQNIEGEGLEDHWVKLITDQIGRDLEDLHWNADSTDTSADSGFLAMNDGWLRQLATSGLSHRVNGALVNSGNVSKDHFSAGIEAMPAKFRQAGRLRWLMNSVNESRYIDYLTDRATAAGDAALLAGDVPKVRGIPVTIVDTLPNSRILLADPQNFIAVNTFDVIRRKTTEGAEAVRRDVRIYAWFLDDDPIIEEQDGVVDIYGLAA